MKIFEDYLIEKELLTESVDIPSELKQRGVTAKIIASALSKTPNPKRIDLQSVKLVKFDSVKGNYIEEFPKGNEYSTQIGFYILEPKRGSINKKLAEKYNALQFFININGVRYIIKNNKLVVLQIGFFSKLDNIISHGIPKWGTLYSERLPYSSKDKHKDKIIGKDEKSINMGKTADVMKIKTYYALTYKYSSSDTEDIIEGWKNNPKTAGTLRKIKLLSDKYIQTPEDESKHKEVYEKRKIMWKLIQQFIDENFTKNDSEIFNIQGVALSDYLWSKFGGLQAFRRWDAIPGNIITAIAWMGKYGGGIYSKKQREEDAASYGRSVQSFIQSGGNMTFGT